MKFKKLLLILSTAFLVTACGSSEPSNPGDDPGTPGESEPPGGGDTPPSGPQKVTVAAHTLKDSNPPITIGSNGEQVNESTWESFRNASDSKFKGNYNFTYTTYSGGIYQVQKFTKNGYMIQSSSGTLYYEKTSGSKVFSYSSTKEGWLRSETNFDIQSKYVSIIKQEIYLHMFDFSNYEYDDWDGTYNYKDFGFASVVMFQNGYLTFLAYALGSNIFRFEYSFETTIDIPESYYYK